MERYGDTPSNLIYFKASLTGISLGIAFTGIRALFHNNDSGYLHEFITTLECAIEDKLPLIIGVSVGILATIIL